MSHHPLQLLQRILKLLREGAGERHLLAGAGVQERQLLRVEALRMQAELRLADAVDGVARDGVADPSHVHADLVRAAGLEAAAQVRILPVARDDLPVRHGLAAVLLRNGHALAVARVAADGRIDRAAVLAEAAADDALIGAAQRVVAELGSKAPVGKVVLRHDEQAGRVAVDAVGYM